MLKILGLIKLIIFRLLGKRIYFSMRTYIHPSVRIKMQKNSTLNLKGSRIMKNTQIILKENANATIGSQTAVLENSHIELDENSNLEINEKTFFNRDCKVYCSNLIKIGYNNAFGPGVIIIDSDHILKRKKDKKYVNWSIFKSKPIIIGNNNWFGAYVTILKGTKIKDENIIGAMTLIKKEIESRTIIYDERNIKIIKKDLI